MDSPSPPPPQPGLVLASTSIYRHSLLQRLGLPFQTASPKVNEQAEPEESGHNLVLRLAKAKAKAVAMDFPNHIIIGSDQVATCNGKILGKPGQRAQAARQLAESSGQQVLFHTGLAVLNTRDGHLQCGVEEYAVVFRILSKETIDRYLHREKPYDCAGSFKSEGLGIALFERMQGNDPSTLMGLPLIRLVRMLEQTGVEVI